MIQKYWIRVGIVGIVVLISWVVYVSSKQLARNERIEHEVTLLQNEAEKIRRENETLGEKIQYFSTADFREQDAKEKLGMKKEREEVVAIKERPEPDEKMVQKTERSDPAAASSSSVIPNYRKWWALFFETT
jgi:cell division protein FtsB